MGSKQKGAKSKKAIGPLLDLHGFKSEDVVDALDRFIRQSESKGASSARIMPGKGKGIVKNEVISYLKLAGYPWSYEKMENGKNNEGVLVVYLD